MFRKLKLFKDKVVNSYHSCLKKISKFLSNVKIKLQSFKIKINNAIDSVGNFIDNIQKAINVLLIPHRFKKMEKLEMKVEKIKKKLGFDDSPEVRENPL